MKWMFVPFRRYFDFSGRSRRLEFWMFILLQFIISIVYYTLLLALVFPAMMAAMRAAQDARYDDGDFDSPESLGFEIGSAVSLPPDEMFGALGVAGIVLGGISLLYSLFAFIPSLAVSIRRLHDSNRTGWWVLAPIGVYVFAIAFLLLGAISPELIVIGVIGSIVGLIAFFATAVLLLVFYFLEGTRGPNRFGPDPKGPGYEQTFA